MKKKLIFPLLTIFLTISALSCESIVGPSTPVPEPTVTTYQGEWTGTTAQGLTVSFTVTSNTVTSFCIDFRNTNNEIVSYAAPDSATVSEDGFNLYVSKPLSEAEEIQGYYSVPIPISATFSSLTSAQGSISVQPPVSWTAEKK